MRLGDRDEFRWRQQPAGGVSPPQEGLEPDEAAPDADLGLVEELELPQCQGAPQVHLINASVEGAPPHALVEEPEGRTAGPLGLVEGEVCGDEEAPAVGAIPGGDRDADADADVGQLPLDQVRALDEVDDAGSDIGGLVRRLGRSEQHGEFVAAEARDDVGLAHGDLDPLRHQAQQLIAGGMAQDVIDGLESVQVEHQDSDRPSVRPGKGGRDLLLEANPIGQAGDGIGPAADGGAGVVGGQRLQDCGPVSVAQVAHPEQQADLRPRPP